MKKCLKYGTFESVIVLKEMRISAVADFRNPQPSGCGFFVV
jgi:hypothetical protein